MALKDHQAQYDVCAKPHGNPSDGCHDTSVSVAEPTGRHGHPYAASTAKNTLKDK